MARVNANAEIQALTAPYNEPTVASVSGLTMRDRNVAGYHVTELVFDGVEITLPEADDYIGTKVLDFPAGRILVQGVTQNMVLTASGGIGATDSLKYAVGTAAADDTTLDTTEVDLIPEDANALAAGTKTVGNALAASAHFDGTSTAKDVYVNFALAVSEDGTIQMDGTIRIAWVFLGDY